MPRLHQCRPRAPRPGASADDSPDSPQRRSAWCEGPRLVESDQIDGAQSFNHVTPLGQDTPSGSGRRPHENRQGRGRTQSRGTDPRKARHCWDALTLSCMKKP
jgi:hypothetical protein